MHRLVSQSRIFEVINKRMNRLQWKKENKNIQFKETFKKKIPL